MNSMRKRWEHAAQITARVLVGLMALASLRAGTKAAINAVLVAKSTKAARFKFANRGII